MTKKTGLKKRTGLGKGLGALLGDSENSNENENNTLNNVAEIPVEEVEANPYQPREENNFDKDALQDLADSITVHGIIQPITVRQLNANSYQLISGERRLRASKIAGLEFIPAYIRTADDQQMLEMALIENIQREDLNPIEIALSYQRLISECDLKQEELGKRVGKQRSTVTNYLRLLRLPPDIQTGLINREISMGHAKELINIENIELQLSIFERIKNEKLSVRKVEEIVREIFRGTSKNAPKKAAKHVESENIKQLQSQLTSHFGTQIKVKTNGKEKGEIKIPFESTEDLNRILELMKYQ